MSMREHFELCRQAFGPNVYNDFMIKHGRDYPTGPRTFDGPRGEQHGCFMNATHLALRDASLTYCEGKVACIVPLDHAWCIDGDGLVIDPTLDRLMLDGGERKAEYFGVPLRTEYVLRAAKLNRIYGCLDFFYARATAPKLFELGLEAGQQWLLDQPLPAKRTRKKRSIDMRTLTTIALLVLSCAVSHAQGQTFKNSNGQIIGRSTTNNAGTTFYNPMGQQTGRAVTNSTGTTFYNASGQMTGRASRR